jgi:hypothetical protein
LCCESKKVDEKGNTTVEHSDSMKKKMHHIYEKKIPLIFQGINGKEIKVV